MTGGGLGIEAVLWVGGRVAVAKTSFLSGGRLWFGGSRMHTAVGRQPQGGETLSVIYFLGLDAFSRQNRERIFWGKLSVLSLVLPGLNNAEEVV